MGYSLSVSDVIEVIEGADDNLNGKPSSVMMSVTEQLILIHRNASLWKEKVHIHHARQ